MLKATCNSRVGMSFGKLPLVQRTLFSGAEISQTGVCCEISGGSGHRSV